MLNYQYIVAFKEGVLIENSSHNISSLNRKLLLGHLLQFNDIYLYLKIRCFRFESHDGEYDTI